MTGVVLRADEHFATLREPVWRRFRARHGADSRDRFEDVYSEFWLRELEREAAGRPSRAAAPVAFVLESLNRLLIDGARARARGLSRDEKHRLEVHDIDDHYDVHAANDTAADAGFNALVHRILDLVETRLSDREKRVFAACFLYLLPTPRAAAELGLSEPRVKKDRLRILEKVGAEVWSVMSAELGCSAARDADVVAGFELMTSHVETCDRCAGLRRGALAVVGPIELLAIGPHGFVDHVVARLYRVAHRVGEAASVVPPTGRAAAVVGLAAAAVAGSGLTATPDHSPLPAVVVATPVAIHATPTASPRVAARRPQPTRTRHVVRPKHPRQRSRPLAAAASPPALRAPPQPVVQPSAPTRPQGAKGEFGFEHD